MGASLSQLSASAAESLGCAPVTVDYESTAPLPCRPGGEDEGWASLPPHLLALLLAAVESAPRDVLAVGPRHRAAARELLTPRSSFRLVCRAWRCALDGGVVSLRPRELHPLALAVSFRNLQTLDLTRIPFPSLPELAKLLALVPALRSLRARDNGAGHLLAATLASALEQPRCQLTSLDLAENHVDDRGTCALASALFGNRTLEQLVLRDNGVTDAGASALARALPTCALRVLDLSCNAAIGVDAACALAHALCAVPAPALATLSLAGCASLGDAGARVFGDALPQCRGLQHLTLASCGIGDGGAVALAEGLRRNTALHRLELSGNDVGDAGALAFAAALRENTALRLLDLFDTEIGAAGVRALAQAMAEGGARCSVRLDLSALGEEEREELQAMAGPLLETAGVRGARRGARRGSGAPWRPHMGLTSLLIEDSGMASH